MKPSIFTPNVVKGGRSGERYRLYQHKDMLFSTTPGGPRFRAQWEWDDCGAGCKCGAYLTPETSFGQEQLRNAKRIDNLSRVIRQ